MPLTSHRKGRIFSIGSLTATGLWVTASAGFSLFVTHFGRYNDMSDTPEMLRWLGRCSVPVERYRSLSEAERKGHFPVGTLVDRNEPDFGARYAQVRERAQHA